MYLIFDQPPPEPCDIRARSPSKYTHESNVHPSKRLDVPCSWLATCEWIVSHSTRSKWRPAGNVPGSHRFHQAALTISMLRSGQWRGALNDVLEYRRWGLRMSRLGFSWQDDKVPGWKWRGKSWRRIETFRWEVLGWGKRPQAGVAVKWLIIWSGSGLWSEEGVDIYCDQPQGLSNEMAEEIIHCLVNAVDDTAFVEFLRKTMARVHMCRPCKSEDSLAEAKGR